MKIVQTISQFEHIPKGCVLTIGNFDGVHLGHQVILTAAKQAATKRQTQLVVMTFEPHPLIVLRPQKAPGILTPLVLKKYLLAEFEVDCLIVLKSTAELLGLSAEDFVQQFLVERIRPSVVVEGKDFNFGVNRAGGVETLQRFADNNGFDVVVVEPKDVKLPTGEIVRVSSTMIRNIVRNGRAADAAIALGRAYRLIGRVVAGKGKGKRLGFPTLNLEPLRQLVPAEGVYAGTVEIGDNTEQVCKTDNKLPAAISIGRAETFGGNNPPAIEGHILAEDAGDLSGRWMAMDFIERIRSQQRFNTEKELSEQIAKDCEKAKEILNNFDF